MHPKMGSWWNDKLIKFLIFKFIYVNLLHNLQNLLHIFIYINLFTWYKFIYINLLHLLAAFSNFKNYLKSIYWSYNEKIIKKFLFSKFHL